MTFLANHLAEYDLIVEKERWQISCDQQSHV